MSKVVFNLFSCYFLHSFSFSVVTMLTSVAFVCVCEAKGGGGVEVSLLAG